MDFMVGLPRCKIGYDAIWMIVDILMKSAHFLSMKNSDSVEKLVELYVKEIVQLHGLLPDSGPAYRKIWVLVYISMRLSILKWMVNLKEPYRHWKICSWLVC